MSEDGKMPADSDQVFAKAGKLLARLMVGLNRGRVSMWADQRDVAYQWEVHAREFMLTVNFQKLKETSLNSLGEILVNEFRNRLLDRVLNDEAAGS